MFRMDEQLQNASGVPLIRAEHVSRDYFAGETTVHALRDVSFDIREGEFIAILGPSGSGKSTMLNILGGIETATAGRILFRGKELDWNDPASLQRYRRESVGFVFQFYNLLSDLTALENVQLGAELSPDPLDAAELICQVGLADRSSHYPSELSGGQQQRVAIARALCKNPDILLCDEPTGALDSATGEQILNVIADFSRNLGKTVVLITHNQSLASYADRIFLFRDGEIGRILTRDQWQEESGAGKREL